MEEQDQPRWNLRALSFKSKTGREFSKTLGATSNPAEDLEDRNPCAEQTQIPKLSALRFNLQENLQRFRRAKKAKQDILQSLPTGIPPQREAEPDPRKRRRLSPIQQSQLNQRQLFLTPSVDENMSLVGQPAVRQNGGPVRQPQRVIDLTSDDEDEEDDFFQNAQELPHIKKERYDAVARQRELLVQMENEGPVLGHGAQGLGQPAVPENPFVRPRDVWGDYALDDEFEDAFDAGELDFELDYGIKPPPPANNPRPATPEPRAAAPIEEDLPDEILESRTDCVDSVLTVFPGICGDYVSELYNSVSKSSAGLIAHILDKMDKGSAYPSAKEKLQKKRKRVVDEDAEAARKYGAPDRIMPQAVGGIRTFIQRILSWEFPWMPAVFITTTLSNTGYRLFSAYEVLEEAERTWTKENAPYHRLKYARKERGEFTDEAVATYLASPTVNHHAGGFVDQEKIEVFQELQAARRIRSKADARRAAERTAEIEEEENAAKAEAEGNMAECQCCWCDYPLNRMVHCDSETMHWFCRGCAKQTAEVEIGKSKYELICMSTDKCSAGFSRDQRAQFLDENTKVALERNEQEAMLRLAGIENLESCPFCPFAAEYPDVEVDREFRCQAPDCEKVSCRLCRLESHIPKSCEEHAKDNGLSIRRLIEEAMSAAMIRKCNKCGTPFVKEEGCNKMTCTRNGCHNIQCYVCSESCDYNHFNDTTRGGKAGNCPLFESVEQRHDDEVKKAEKEALEKVLADHPEYSEEDLKVKMSENVKKDDEKRKNMDPRARLEAMAQRMHAGRPAGFFIERDAEDADLARIMRGGRLAYPRYRMREPPMEPVEQAAQPEGYLQPLLDRHVDVNRQRLNFDPGQFLFPDQLEIMNLIAMDPVGFRNPEPRQNPFLDRELDLEPQPGNFIGRARARARWNFAQNPLPNQQPDPVVPPRPAAHVGVPRPPDVLDNARQRVRILGPRVGDALNAPNAPNAPIAAIDRFGAEMDALQRQLDQLREAADAREARLAARNANANIRNVDGDERLNDLVLQQRIPVLNDRQYIRAPGQAPAPDLNPDHHLIAQIRREAFAARMRMERARQRARQRVDDIVQRAPARAPGLDLEPLRLEVAQHRMRMNAMAIGIDRPDANPNPRAQPGGDPMMQDDARPGNDDIKPPEQPAEHLAPPPYQYAPLYQNARPYQAADRNQPNAQAGANNENEIQNILAQRDRLQQQMQLRMVQYQAQNNPAERPGENFRDLYLQAPAQNLALERSQAQAQVLAQRTQVALARAKAEAQKLRLDRAIEARNFRQRMAQVNDRVGIQEQRQFPVRAVPGAWPAAGNENVTEPDNAAGPGNGVGGDNSNVEQELDNAKRESGNAREQLDNLQARIQRDLTMIGRQREREGERELVRVKREVREELEDEDEYVI